MFKIKLFVFATFAALIVLIVLSLRKAGGKSQQRRGSRADRDPSP